MKSNFLIIILLPFINVGSNIENTSIQFNEKISFKLNLYSKDSVIIETIKKNYIDVSNYENGYLVFSDKSRIIYNDKKTKSRNELLDKPDIQDMFYWKYNPNNKIPIEYEDPGRIRNENFFKAIYGTTKENVRSNLKSFIWCPKLVNQSILFNKKNGALEALQKVSNELDKHPEWRKYLTRIGGTFNWRKINGTERLSAHSFGITIDINIEKSNYWQWDCNCTNENVKLRFINKIPLELVQIFEKNGFIWGGRWYHYDTMHFEYRPELLN